MVDEFQKNFSEGMKSFVDGDWHEAKRLFEVGGRSIAAEEVATKPCALADGMRLVVSAGEAYRGPRVNEAK